MVESRRYRKDIESQAVRFGLDPDLVEAIVRVESSGLTHAYRYEPKFWLRYLADNPLWNKQNPRRVSASYGLMQIMYPTAFERGFSGQPEGLFIPEVGLEWGCRQLKWLADKVGFPRAVAGYNGGLGGSREPWTPAISSYVNKVSLALSQVKEGPQ